MVSKIFQLVYGFPITITEIIDVSKNTYWNYDVRAHDNYKWYLDDFLRFFPQNYENHVNSDMNDPEYEYFS